MGLIQRGCFFVVSSYYRYLYIGRLHGMSYCRLVINIHICDGFTAVPALNG
jgi:hypothetical protein